MLTKYIDQPNLRGNCLHNGAHWQLTEYMGGLCCELLQKTRVVDREDQAQLGAELHDCYPSLFFQGDDATEFLREFENAQARLNPAELNRLFFDNYAHVMQ